MLLVENPKHFADLVLDTKKKLREGETFANRFTSFVFIPINADGAQQAKEYMSAPTKTYIKNLADLAIQSGVYKQNKEGHTDLFPLVTQDDMPVFVGVFMDVIPIHRITKLLSISEFEFGILCYPWQIAYYERVLPKAKFLTME